MKDELYSLIIDSDSDFKQYEKLLSFISIDKQKIINLLRFDIDKKLSLFSDLAIRYLIHKKRDIPNENILFSKTDYGKPYVRGVYNFHYNNSHTRDAIAIAISTKPIGVDIEKTRIADMQIARKIFTENERAYIMDTKDSEELNRRFFELWTRKEAYVKWVGKGLTIPLKSVDVLEMASEFNITTMAFHEYIVSVVMGEGVNNHVIKNKTLRTDQLAQFFS